MRGGGIIVLILGFSNHEKHYIREWKSKTGSLGVTCDLPKAVVRYQGVIENRHRKIYVEIVRDLNSALPAYPHVEVAVGVVWS